MSDEDKLSPEMSIELDAFDHGGSGLRGRPLPVNRLTSREMDSLTAISDALLPSINVLLPRSTPDIESIRAFYFTSASMMGTPEILGGYMSGRLQHAMLGLLRLALWFLSTWYGTFALCGTKSLSRRFPYFQKLSQVEPARREEILRSWSFSSIYLLRQLARGLKYLVMLIHFTQVDERNQNLTWRALGYCGPDPAHVDQVKQWEIARAKPDEERKEEESQEQMGPLHKGLVHMPGPRDALSSALDKAGLKLAVRPGHKQLLTIRCDAVVVGSGSGGGVVAGVLAKAGYKVLVLEKGGYYTRSSLSLLEGPTMDQMYEGSGLLATTDLGVTILSGSTVGGGSAINWSASIRTPDHVVSEWRDKHGLELFGSDAYENALDVVCKHMGVQPDVEDESLNNAVLRRGCTELGYPVKNIPRNSPSDHHCGWCCFGCKDGRKKGTCETWLVDLVESGNGVILAGSKAIKLLHEDRKRHKNIATGVIFEFENKWSGQKETCLVESKVTVVACGALRTPVLLKKSGLRNKNIGRHLHLHPVVMTWGYFPEIGSRWPKEEHVQKRSYEGAIMTAMMPKVVAKSNTKTTGYGVIIQTPALHPGMFSAVMPWVSGADFKQRMARFARTAHIFALARDRGEGTVDADGNITYQLDSRDEENLKEGVERMLWIMAAAGATEMGTQHCEGESLDVRSSSWHKLERFVRAARGRGLRKLSTPICSAHQMGSCRMGVRPETSAVDPRGESWEVEGLFVADTSVFPTALGVNPMVTVQAIAYCTAQSVLEVLKRKMKLRQHHGR